MNRIKKGWVTQVILLCLAIPEILLEMRPSIIYG